MGQTGATSLTIITGPMFSAKTERLIAEIKMHGYARSRIRVGKPAGDTRTQDFIASRRIQEDGVSTITDRIPATPILNADEFIAFTDGEEYDVLAFDEAQFFELDDPMQDSLGWFGRAIRDLLDRRRDSSLQILIAGLDTNSDDMPFGAIPGLLALADKVEKLSAVCMACHAMGARKSQLLKARPARVRIGDIDQYEARCRSCFSFD